MSFVILLMCVKCIIYPSLICFHTDVCTMITVYIYNYNSSAHDVYYFFYARDGTMAACTMWSHDPRMRDDKKEYFPYISL